MSDDITGIHHVTAIAGDPQRNVDFYTGLLGMRLVKLTVNFDAPDTYHLYYGDNKGSPGTLLTFFPWPGGRTGHPGTGQVTVTSWSIPIDAVGFWVDRFKRSGVDFTGPADRLDERVITFLDPDGLALEIVAHPHAAGPAPQTGNGVPERHAIRGLHTVTLAQQEAEGTPSMLTSVLGFRKLAKAGNRLRYGTGDNGPGKLVDVLVLPDMERGVVAVGSVHHVAFRVPNDAAQHTWRDRLREKGVHATSVVDRTYFRSIYFREPGGVLFEIATDTPGFAVDEPPERLGTRLALPPWLEPRRSRIERMLPDLRVSELRVP